MKKGLIIGKGWLGSRLEKYLEKQFLIETTKRISDAENCFSIDFDDYKFEKIKHNYDFIIVTIPFGRRNNLEDLQERFHHLIDFLGDYNNQLILLSSIVIYPENNEIIFENSIETIYLNNPYYSIENQLKEKFNQLIILRLGGLMGDDRFLSKYLTLEHPNLSQIVNHIHYKDVCQVIKKMINKNKNSSIYNVVAPIHPTKEEVLEYQLNKKTISSKNRDGKIISSQKIQDEFNYEFIYPDPVYFKEN
ncbi:epimerase [Empedobacter falsenii]|uniref:epimerase n=1 Tax=Empedobacter falsenii TaxID=343874 RepID=UPI001C5A360D|nr:epimerase [Empedobacter falsenii]MBW1619512.1 epimerase [Empedobacter falsenii]